MTTLDQRADLTRVALPPAADLAAAVVGGTNAVALAARFGCSVSTVRNRLNDGGFNSGTGRPHAPRAVLPEVGFDYRGDEGWIPNALCHRPGMKADWWDHDTKVSGEAKYALKVCAQCPVRDACLAYALKVEENSPGRYGIWGGMVPDERAALAKRAAS